MNEGNNNLAGESIIPMTRRNCSVTVGSLSAADITRSR